MLQQGADEDPDQRTILSVARVVWAAFLAGQVMFLLMIAIVWEVGTPFNKPMPDLAHGLCVVGLVLLALLVPLGYVLRGQIYKRHWRGARIMPRGYLIGNIVLLGLCEVVSMVGLVGVLFAGTFWPGVIPSFLAMAVQVVNFPNGRAMEATGPVFTQTKNL